MGVGKRSVEVLPVHVIRDHILKYHPRWSILKAEIVSESLRERIESFDPEDATSRDPEVKIFYIKS